MDQFTRWPEVIPLRDTTTETVIHGFLLGWVARFGVPSTITTDREGQCESTQWSRLMQMLGIHRIHTTAYHLSANGLVECMHCQLKTALRTHSPSVHWTDSLPFVLLGMRSSLKEDIQGTNAELVYGTSLRLPGEYFTTTHPDDIPDPTSYVSQLQSAMRQLRVTTPPWDNNQKLHISPDLHSSSHVFIRWDSVKKALQHQYDGPFAVVKCSDKCFTPTVHGRQTTVSIDRLKPAHIDVVLTAAACRTTCSGRHVR